MSTETWLETHRGEPCSNCGMSYEDCTKRILQMGRTACCPTCASTDTHDERQGRAEPEAHECGDVAEAIRAHVDHMETYTLPALEPGFMKGYDHALRLFRRDAGFIAHKVERGEKP